MAAVMLARRSFLAAAGSLVVGFSLAPKFAAAAEEAAAKAAGKIVDPTAVDAFLAIGRDNRVTIYTGKVDLGTGARAAYPQMVAEELGVALSAIDVIEGDTALTPDQGRTSGSNGVPVGGVQLRQAAATARQAFVEMAAKKWDRPAVDLVVADGMVKRQDGGAAISFADLLGDKSFDLKLDKSAPIIKPDAYKYVGRSVPRPDLPAKLTGRHTYVHDFKLEGMLHGRVIRPAAPRATLARVDEASIAGLPGGARIVRIGNFLGVVAEREWAAVRAAKTLKVEWTETPSLPGSDDLHAFARKTEVARDETLKKTGDASAALAGAGVMKATYAWPAQMHGSIGPSCAVADVRPDGATIWTASQATHAYRPAFAKALGLAPENVRLIYLDGAGCYGMNGHDDAAADAALLSRAVGKPVRVQWMRHDEHAGEPKGPPQLLDVAGKVDKDGRIAAWQTETWLPENTKGLPVVPLLAFDAAGIAQPQGQSSGLTHLNSDPPYKIADVHAFVHWVKGTPLRPSNLRAPGKIANVFAVECFTDELAASCGADPLAFRLQALDDPRGREVLTRVAAMMNWQARRSPLANDPRASLAQGRGIAYVHYKQVENYVAIGAEVEVERASGRIAVKRMVCAHDCGLMVNPDAVRAQVEGSLLQTVSRTLFEEVAFDTTRVTSLDWSSYPIMTFLDMPTLEIDLIQRLHERPLGAGEAAAAPVTAAIGNAVFDATGARLRQVPFTSARVKEALASRPT